MRSMRLIIFLAFLFPAILDAQDFVSISGRIIDTELHNPIAGVIVTALPDGVSTISNNNGEYHLPHLLPGSITLIIESAFHHQVNINPLLLRAGETKTLDIDLEPQTISLASQNVTSIRESQVGLQVFTLQEIKSSNAEDIGDFLKEQGFFLQSDGRSKYISLHGYAPNRVLVLLDGQPLNPDGGAVDLSSIPTETIERIEVLTSGAATRFGANALGGAVNIISRSIIDNNRELQLSVSQGSYSHHQEAIALQQQLPVVNLLANYQYSYSKNNFEYEHPYQGQLERFNNYQRQYSGYLSLNVKEVPELHFTTRVNNNHSGIPGTVSQETRTAKAKRSNQVYNLSYTKSHFQINAGYLEMNQSFYDNGAFIPYQKNYLQIGRQLELNWQPKTIEFLSSTLNARYLSESFFSDDLIKQSSSLPTISRRTVSFSYQANPHWNWKQLHVGSNLAYRIDRLDDHSFTSPHINGSASYHSFITVTTEVAYSENYHYPPNNALFWQDGVFATGNPDLLSEESITREVVIKFEYDQAFLIKFEHKWFKSDLDNLIVWRRRFDGRYSPINIDKTEHNGRKLSLALTTHNKLLSFSYNRLTLIAINKSSQQGYFDNIIPFTPDQVESFGLNLNYWKLRFDYNYSFTGKRFIREANTKSQPPYALHDVSLEITTSIFNMENNINLEILNITNHKYNLLERMPMPPRTFQLTFELKL